MSIWKELKKIVNSNFNKTLDVQIAEQATSIINRINSLTFLDASDDIYKSMPDKELSVRTNSTNTANYVYPKLKMYNSGSLKVKSHADYTSISSGGSPDYSFSFMVKKNDSTIFSSTATTEQETTITFEGGDVLSFEFSLSVSSGSGNYVTVACKLRDFSLCGTVRQSIFEVI